MKGIVIYILLLLELSLYGQGQRNWTVKSGERIQDVIPLKELYSYEAFTPGTVFFKDGKAVAGKLNLNMLIGEMQFLDPNGDTLSIANEKMIRLIVVGRDSFLVNRGCWRYISSNGNYSIVEKITFREYFQKGGAYGMSSAVGSTESISTMVTDRGYKLSTDQEKIVVRSNQYGVADRSWEVIYPDRKKINKILTKHKMKLDNYFSSSPITATRLGDFEKLVEFLSSLEN